MHDVFSLTAFFALVIGMVVFARIVYMDPAWRSFTWFSIAVAMLNLMVSPIFLLEMFEAIEGLLQRSFYFTLLVWLELVALRSLRLSSTS